MARERAEFIGSYIRSHYHGEGLPVLHKLMGDASAAWHGERHNPPRRAHLALVITGFVVGGYVLWRTLAPPAPPPNPYAQPLVPTGSTPANVLP